MIPIWSSASDLTLCPAVPEMSTYIPFSPEWCQLRKLPQIPWRRKEDKGQQERSVKVSVVNTAGSVGCPVQLCGERTKAALGISKCSGSHDQAWAGFGE